MAIANHNSMTFSQCLHEPEVLGEKEKVVQLPETPEEPVEVRVECTEMTYSSELRVNMIPKKAQSSHQKVGDNTNVKKTTKSAHLLGEAQLRTNVDTVCEM